MNIKKNFLLVCENAILDDKNRLSLINTFDVISAQKIPIVHSGLFVIANLGVEEVKKSANIKISVEIVSPSTKQIIQNPPVIERPLKMKDSVQNVGGIFDIRNIIFPEFGMYSVNLIVNGKKLGIFYLELKEVKAQDVN